MWWIKDPDRLKREAAAVDALLEQQPWLSTATPRLTENFALAFDFDLIVNSETLSFTLQYPAFFPETPPLVIPRNGRQLSNHQYGIGGELCLEFRPDNWEPSVTGSMLIESTHRLLSTEKSALEQRAIVPSAHSVSLGQELRGWVCRFLLTRSVIQHIADLSVGAYRDATIIDRAVPTKTWTAHIETIGPIDAPDWREPGIPNGGENGGRSVLIRVASLSEVPLLPDQAFLDQLSVDAQNGNAVRSDINEDRCRFTVIADSHSATLFYSFPKEDAWIVLPYKSVYLTDDTEQRLPRPYGIIAQKKVGIVGC